MACIAKEFDEKIWETVLVKWKTQDKSYEDPNL